MLTDGVHFPLRSAAAHPFRPAATLASLVSLNTRHPESRTTMAWLFPFDDDLLVLAMACSRQTTRSATLSMKFPTAGKPHSRQAVPNSRRTPFICEAATGGRLRVRHSLNANYVWQLPVKTVLRGRGPDYLVKGWQVSGTIFARTGFPYTVIDLAESGTSLRRISMEQSSVPSSHSAGRSCGASAVVPPFPHPCRPPQVLTWQAAQRQIQMQISCKPGAKQDSIRELANSQGFVRRYRFLPQGATASAIRTISILTSMS